MPQQNKIWKHGELIEDLKKHLDMPDRIMLVEPHLGSSTMHYGKIAIPDIFCFQKSFAKPDFKIFEVKVSDSDLRGDVMSGKWEKYLPYCDRVIFALPEYVKWEQILGNQPAGVMVRYPNCWRTMKKGALNQKRKTLSEEVFIALMIYLDETVSKVRELELEKEHLLQKDIEKIRYSVDEKLRKRIEELDKKINESQHLLKYGREEAFKDYCEKLGIPSNYFFDNQETETIIRKLFTMPLDISIRNIIENGMKKLFELKTSEERLNEIL